jgi:two-component system, LytTR family, sensor kinase
MKAWLKPNKIEWLTFLVMMPVVAVAFNYLLFEERLWSDIVIWQYSVPIVYVQGFLSWYAHILIMHALRREYPLIEQTIKRLMVLAIFHILLTSLTFASIILIYNETGFLGYYEQTWHMQTAVFIAIALTMVATTLWEADYTVNQWKNKVAEKDKLEQLALQQEFSELKSQVNPHFLFNCFNTLSSLITEDKKQAEIFLNELSKVYRYLLKNNENSMSTLRAEVKFIESYYRLLQTRHGEAVQLKLDIDKKHLDYLLPSLSLQLLVENAVKHNTLSKADPLLIDIFSTAGNKLVVNNNLKKRTIKGKSTGIGLENIRSKYLLLGQNGVQIIEDQKNFSVVLPLIWSKVTTHNLVHS